MDGALNSVVDISPLLKFLAMRLVPTANIYQKIPSLVLIYLSVVLWFLVAVHFISELTKFELIIITIFEHNCVHLFTNCQNKCVFIANALLNARYLDIAPTTTMGVAKGGTWAMLTKIYKFENVPPILPILQKGRTTVE